MTTIYFVRHAEADSSVHDPATRPLTAKGLRDRALVTAFLKDKNIGAVFSSPYKRAADTVADFADSIGYQVILSDSFKEHNTISDNYPNDEYFRFISKYWEDYYYKVQDDESLSEVQRRNISAIDTILFDYKDKNIVIGTHGTALSTIINYYDNSYGFNDFMAMVSIKPWVVRMDFSEDGCVGMEKIDLFSPNLKADYSNPRVNVVNLGLLKAYRFVVVFARYKDKWLYCRAKERDTYETAGGHIEHGETTLDAAKRELYEETGAISFDIMPAFDYSVHIPTQWSNGQVFFAQIHELGKIPDYEMAETCLFDGIPEKMRFPEILPYLYDRMQMWLNLQS